MVPATEAHQGSTVIDHRPLDLIMRAHHRGWLSNLEPIGGACGAGPRTWVHRLWSAHDDRYDVLAEHYPQALDRLDLALALAGSLAEPDERDDDPAGTGPRRFVLPAGLLAYPGRRPRTGRPSSVSSRNPWQRSGKGRAPASLRSLTPQ